MGKVVLLDLTHFGDHFPTTDRAQVGLTTTRNTNRHGLSIGTECPTVHRFMGTDKFCVAHFSPSLPIQYAGCIIRAQSQ
jgi:hypothetical protein